MTDKGAQVATSIAAEQADYLIATAARAPSVHNTQPWRFKVTGSAIDLYADQRRKLRTDPAGREMLISCGAALFGLRLAVRTVGYLPIVDLLPDPADVRLLARVRLGTAVPMTTAERAMATAIPHRHTHRGPFADRALPAGLLPRLQHDVMAEGATLVIVGHDHAYHMLAEIVRASGHRHELDPLAREEMRRWSRVAGDPARDGIPAHAFGSSVVPGPGRLPQRDFDLGRGLGQLTADGPPPAATAVLVTAGDGRADWLNAGQALHRLLAYAASKWVFASLHSQPLETEAMRALIRQRLGLPGVPQMLMQLSPTDSTRATARRPPADLIEP